MGLDPQFAEPLTPHRGCPSPLTWGRHGRLVGKMTRLYYPNRETLRWVPVGVLCLDCGAVELHHRPRADSPVRPPPR